MGTATWILLFTNLVPISLIVQFDICKLAQAGFMAADLEMYDHDQGAFCKA